MKRKYDEKIILFFFFVEDILYIFILFDVNKDGCLF